MRSHSQALTEVISKQLSFPCRGSRYRESNELLEAVVRKARLYERKKHSLTALFRTMMYQLMTAQLRVHDLDLPDFEAINSVVKES